jgi:hypothetical protein
MDLVVTWILADPNSQILEILPEECNKIAFSLKNALLCRASFAVLVSEETLSLAARSNGRHNADKKTPFNKFGTNQFGRVREEVDEDLTSRIEYASKAFRDRINVEFGRLANAEMKWLDTLAELRKLHRFRDAICVQGAVRNRDRWNSAVNSLMVKLQHWVRGRIMGSLVTQMRQVHGFKNGLLS